MNREFVARPVAAWDLARPTYSPDTLGLNYAWLKRHNDGAEDLAWLGAGYDAAAVEGDLAGMAALGVRKIRAFCLLEAMMSWDGASFAWVEEYASHLTDFLDRCVSHGLTCILVMHNGGVATEPVSLDGRFRWALTQSAAGVNTLVTADRAYADRFAGHPGALALELINEPYGNVHGFSPYPSSLGVTVNQAHDYLLASYTELRLVVPASVPVLFSEYEEYEQPQFRTFSDDVFRARYVDDCTDVYAMHIYRPGGSTVFDFRNLGSKPKWLQECGHINYNDPSASAHPIPGHMELRHPVLNPQAVRALGAKAMAAGFELVMPWSWADNPTVAAHRADGTHALGPLANWMRTQLAPRPLRS
jgi:hypothetical protein